MSRGRPALKEKLVQTLQGSGHAKGRLEVILKTLSGEATVSEACAELGIGETAFHRLRRRTLQDALASLEPRSPGRPRQYTPEEEDELAQMKSELKELDFELQASRIREEIALTMPHVLKRRDAETEEGDEPKSSSKKKSPNRRLLRQKRKQERQRRRRKS
ncbi:MAG: helix-turn-helix domain-containing protein [Rhodosalinus sp.]